MLLVTTTKNRPVAFNHLATLVKRMDGAEYHDWLVVTDGDTEDYKFPKNKRFRLIERDNSEDIYPSLNHNLLCALDNVGDHDKIVLLEDDDWYSPNYLKETEKMLDRADLFGWCEDFYYHVLSRRPQRLHNQDYASLAATAFKPSVIPYLKACCERGDYAIDWRLWRGWVQKEPAQIAGASSTRFAGPEVSYLINFNGRKELRHNFWGVPVPGGEPEIDESGAAKGTPRHVGIKENWHKGSDGLSRFGHKPSGGFDPMGVELKKQIGEEDAKFYLKFTVTPKFGTPWLMLPHVDEKGRPVGA